jgi:hypothetical protein
MCGTSGSVIRRSARAHPGERATIKHVRDGVARFDHNQADRTGLKISAIVARSERGDRRAGKGGQRTIESAHDRANPDFMSRARESVATPFAFLGVDEARIGLGDVRDLSEPIRLKAGQMDHGLEAILPLLREHNPILTFGREPCSLSCPFRQGRARRPGKITRPELAISTPDGKERRQRVHE